MAHEDTTQPRIPVCIDASKLRRTTGVWIAVVICHAILVGLFIEQPTHRLRLQGPVAPLVLISLTPTRKERAARYADLSIGTLLPAVPSVPNVPSSDAAEEPSHLVSEPLPGRVTPPRPAEDQIPESREFARRAGLQPGVGTTVVLRVEVRSNGDVGRVAVEVSGGTALIDETAVACVRAMRWIAGERDGQPLTLWVRWGVRLDG